MIREKYPWKRFPYFNLLPEIQTKTNTKQLAQTSTKEQRDIRVRYKYRLKFYKHKI